MDHCLFVLLLILAILFLSFDLRPPINPIVFSSFKLPIRDASIKAIVDIEGTGGGNALAAVVIDIHSISSLIFQQSHYRYLEFRVGRDVPDGLRYPKSLI